ncbi:MAG: DUF1097 domain-containing protein [Lachnospiraceae bacterium]|nr:DUF1097 domain-containing protein [Lachnospiraceae bacterium]
MSSLCALALATAVLCGLWSYLSGRMGLFGWAGFAGCTTYFASGKHGIMGLKKTILPNMAGVLCGMVTMLLGSAVPAFGEWGIWCALLTFVMCIIARFELFDFCPGTFMGCFCTFAAGGEWKTLIISLILGAFLGLACDCGGVWLYNWNNKNNG